VTYVDKHGPAVAFVEETVKTLGVEDYIKIFRMDVFKFMKMKVREPYSYIFAGPPYPLKNIPEIPELIFEAGLLAPNGLFVMETNPHHDFAEDPRCVEKRNYGKTIFWFFKRLEDISEEE
jgi:16S rRNA G966 N2-methylase RsmD